MTTTVEELKAKMEAAGIKDESTKAKAGEAKTYPIRPVEIRTFHNNTHGNVDFYNGTVTLTAAQIKNMAQACGFKVTGDPSVDGEGNAIRASHKISLAVGKSSKGTKYASGYTDTFSRQQGGTVEC